MKDVYEKQVQLMKRFNQPTPPVPIQIAHLYPPGPQNPHYETAMQREMERRGGPIPIANGPSQTDNANKQVAQKPDQQLTEQQRRQQQAQQAAAGFADKLTASMMEGQLEDSEPPTIKLGDASVAAPFTSKLANVIAIPNIIRQGRCTLVATIQMYKILALNCLISAYSLSVLYLEGIKFGDGQVTINGMLMSVCFLSISRAKVCHIRRLHGKTRYLTDPLAGGTTFKGTPSIEHFQPLHYRVCIGSICRAHFDTDLPVQLRSANRAVSIKSAACST